LISYERRPISLTSDIDRTLLAGDWHPEDRPYADAALESLTQRIRTRKASNDLPPFYVGTSTGRTLLSHCEELETKDNKAFCNFVTALDSKTGSVGAEIEYRRGDGGLFEPSTEWPGELSTWDRDRAYLALHSKEQNGELLLQPPMAQSPYKLSFFVKIALSRYGSYAKEIEDLLLKDGIATTTIFSDERYLDILPRQSNGGPVDKGTAKQHISKFFAERDSLAVEPIEVYAGDGWNDVGGLVYAIESGGIGIIPENAKESFKEEMRAKYPKTVLHIAHTARFAAAIEECLDERHLLS